MRSFAGNRRSRQNEERLRLRPAPLTQARIGAPIGTLCYGCDIRHITSIRCEHAVGKPRIASLDKPWSIRRQDSSGYFPAGNRQSTSRARLAVNDSREPWIFERLIERPPSQDDNKGSRQSQNRADFWSGVWKLHAREPPRRLLSCPPSRLTHGAKHAGLDEKRGFAACTSARLNQRAVRRDVHESRAMVSKRLRLGSEPRRLVRVTQTSLRWSLTKINMTINRFQ